MTQSTLLKEPKTVRLRAAGSEDVVVECIERVEEFRALRDEWNELLGQSDSDGLFLTWEWLFTWWKHLANGRRLRILTVRSKEQLVAAAPLSIRAIAPMGASLFGTVEFLGTGSVGSDYLDVIVRRGYRSLALAALGRVVPHERIRLVLGQMAVEGTAAEELAKTLTRRGWKAESAVTNVCPYIDLTGHSWESYLETLSSSHRYNFRRRLRNLNKRYQFRFEEATSDEARSRALEALFALHRKRWSPRGGSEAFYSPALLEFHREMSQIALVRGWLRLYSLLLDGTPVASIYAFHYGRVFSFYQSGFDPKHARESVGLVALGLSIRRAMEEGASEYDLLHGSEDYKFHWAHQTRKLGRLELYPPSASGALTKRLIETARLVRDAARRFLPREVLSAQSEWRKRLAARTG